MRFELDQVTLGLDEAIPCGLVVNELVCNALKYAFPGGRQGSVKVGLAAKDDGMVLIVVEDDGVGLPEDLDVEKVGTLGLQLVTLLVKQLQGTVQVTRAPGTHVSIRFPKHAARS